jgi:hypothetical protein
MNLKEAKKIRPGAIVRESWATTDRTGLVLSKVLIKESHVAKVLCHKKEQRYDIVVHWFGGPRAVGWEESHNMKNPETMQNWELMVVSHT